MHQNGARQKELQFHLQNDRHFFLDGPLRCDPSRFFKKAIAIFLKTKFAEFCRDLPRFALRSDRHFFLVGPDRLRCVCGHMSKNETYSLLHILFFEHGHLGGFYTYIIENLYIMFASIYFDRGGEGVLKCVSTLKFSFHLMQCGRGRIYDEN